MYTRWYAFFASPVRGMLSPGHYATPTVTVADNPHVGRRDHNQGQGNEEE